MGSSWCPYMPILLLIQLGRGSTVLNILHGIDVSIRQPNLDWNSLKTQGITFVYVKATQGISYKSPIFKDQYTGARKAGLFHGAYHYALPDKSSGATQAKYFLANGGGWSSDGRTLHGTFNMEYNPDKQNSSSGKCYGLSQAAMQNWIRDFGEAYRSSSGRYPVIYMITPWWKECVGDNGKFGQYPLWIDNYASVTGPLPVGWKVWTFWEFADDTGPVPGFQDKFRGTLAKLKKFAKG